MVKKEAIVTKFIINSKLFMVFDLRFMIYFVPL